jgi:cobaltochelatase CobT
MSDPLDIFKEALKQTTRALAQSDDLDVQFSTDPSTKDGLTNTDVIRLPQITPKSTEADLSYVRGLSDSIALQKRFHDPQIFLRYEPTGSEAQVIYQTLEIARIECLGSKMMQGVAQNLQHKFATDALKPAQNEIESTAREISKRLRDLILETKKHSDNTEAFDSLSKVLDNQKAYARLMRTVLKDMGYGDQLGDDPDKNQEEDDPLGEQKDTPQNEQTPQDANPEKQTESQSDEMKATDTSDASEMMTPLQASLARLEFDSDQDTTATDLQKPVDMDEEAEAEAHQYHVSKASPGYTVYTTEYDETLPADALCDPEELTRLRSYLDTQLEPYKGTVSKLANRLQRQLI